MMPAGFRAFPRALAASLFLAAWLAVPGEVGSQCSMCRKALSSPEGRSVVSAYRSAILFLLTAPFATAGIIGYLVLRQRQRPDRGARQGPPS
jgi:hypothetical protein